MQENEKLARDVISVQQNYMYAQEQLHLVQQEQSQMKQIYEAKQGNQLQLNQIISDQQQLINQL